MRIHFPQARGGWNGEGSLPLGISKRFLNQGNQAAAINMKNPITMIVMAGALQRCHGRRAGLEIKQ
jgi:hypothetical protein